jgi:alanine-glyoxylate transaminase/serine-glyoxylate transaminase/serine-pyruvate transaminase
MEPRWAVGRRGRHFLHIPGPANVPERILRAMDRAVIDHRGPEFARLLAEIDAGLREVFQTSGPVLVFPASGSGGWEAALVNTLSAGDRVLAFDQGFFANGWAAVAERHGLKVQTIAQDWRRRVDAAALEEALVADAAHEVRAVLIVHNETSTGVTSDVGAVRAALDRAAHPALLMVDAVSSLASIDYRHDEWGVDVTITGSQKGLMLPPGLSFNAISERALAASRTAGLARSYWRWEEMLAANEKGFFPYTPATTILYGLCEALAMFLEEGLNNVFARHRRMSLACGAAVTAWGLERFAQDDADASHTVTAVMLPEGHDADRLRDFVLNHYDLSLGAGLGKLKGKVFRIGHLGDLNELMFAGALCGVDMGLRATGVPHTRGGVDAALEFLGP